MTTSASGESRDESRYEHLAEGTVRGLTHVANELARSRRHQSQNHEEHSRQGRKFYKETLTEMGNQHKENLEYQKKTTNLLNRIEKLLTVIVHVENQRDLNNFD